MELIPSDASLSCAISDSKSLDRRRTITVWYNPAEYVLTPRCISGLAAIDDAEMDVLHTLAFHNGDVERLDGDVAGDCAG